MKKYLTNIITALLCFGLVIILNFMLPRLLPGDPVAYLSGEDLTVMSPAQYEHYREVLHLDDSVPKQLTYYLKSLVDGTLGYSYKKDDTVAHLIGRRIPLTLQITLPAVLFSTVIGLIMGLGSGYRKGRAFDTASSTAMMVVHAMPTFFVAFLLVILFSFKNSWLPYAGANSRGVEPNTVQYVLDRIKHLILPVGAITIATTPSRYLMMRNNAALIADEKYVLYAKERGLSDLRIQFGYMLKNIAQPFIAMVGMSVGACVGGSLVVENIFSINGMGSLLMDAVYTLDYPLMQGVLFITTLIMVTSIVVTDIICIVIDPRVRLGDSR